MPDVIDIIRSTLNDDSRRLQSISQNLANINTIGYKREIDAEFPSVIINQQGSLSHVNITARDGQPDSQALRDISPSVVKKTGNQFDLAILQDGFFGVQGSNGEFLYTRKGNFSLDQEGRLINGSGMVLQGENGPIHDLTADFKVNSNGEVVEGGAVVDKINVYQLVAQSCEYVGNGLFKSSSATLLSNDMVHMQQGVLEASNVDSTYEMLKMIEVTRRFESTSKILGNYDRLVGDTINTLGNF